MDIEVIEGRHWYRIVRLVAHGGMGSVYEAHQVGAEGFYKTVAIKSIRARFAKDEEFKRLFIGEAKLVADLVHENIVQVYHLGVDDDLYYIVMEYVSGITLERFIRHHLDHEVPLPVELGAFIASRICRGLEYAHTRRDRTGQPLGIVHRDISPKNVLLSFEGVVKVTDFGIAKAREVMEQDEKVLMGRVEYMSPEQAQRKGTDGRSDLYSLGVLTYEILTGTLPSRGAGSLSRLHQLGMSYSRPVQAVRREVPDDLAGIIDRALQPDPADRFQHAGEMGYALEYHLYHDGYGPTNVTLGDYLKRTFAGGDPSLPEPLAERLEGSGRIVEHRAETMFGRQLADTEAETLRSPPADTRPHDE